MRIRKYLETDREHCLAVFDSVSPGEYDPGRRTEFADFLDDHPEPLWVVEEHWHIVGCGGVRVEPDGRTARLCWGMVRLDHQQEGWGSYLLGAILAWARRQPGLRRVLVPTVEANREFFEELGFQAVDAGAGASEPEGDRVVMALELE